MALVFTLAWAPVARAGDVSGGIDLFELHPAGTDPHLAMESTFMAGNGLGQFGLKVDGGSETRIAFDQAQVQALWMPIVAPGITLALGVRHDIREGANLTHADFGAEVTLLPWLAGEHYLFLSQHGKLTGAGKLTARWSLGPRLVLEPRVQIGWAAQPIPAEDIAGGLTDLQASVRLRHAVSRHLDVYLGVTHQTLLGGTADIARAGGGSARVTRAVVGAGLSL